MTKFLSEEKKPNQTTKGGLHLLLNGERKTLTDDAKNMEVFDVFLLHSLAKRSAATRWQIQ